MKFKQFLISLLFILLIVFLSYSLCSTHELSNKNGYISRRKRFCTSSLSTKFIGTIIVYILIHLYYTYL